MTRAVLIVLLICAAALAPHPAAANEPGEYGRSWGICTEHTGRAEREHGIPRHLLGAIALAESGRWDDLSQENVAWPWTVMAEGRGRYLPTKAAAVAEVRALQARGVDNIDVGCMQVNLYHHGDAFPDLETAFDPAANTAYAARFLTRLRDDSGSWRTAASHYHSRTPSRARAYGRKVAGLWHDLKDGSDAPSATTTAAPGAITPLDDNAAHAAAHAAALTVKTRAVPLPIDIERTNRLNARMRGDRAAARESAGIETRHHEIVAWGEDQARAAEAAHEANLRRAERNLVPSRRALARTAETHAEAFAARRRAQLAAWRNDPLVWQRAPEPIR